MCTMDTIYQELQFLDLREETPGECCTLLEIIKPGLDIPGVELPWGLPRNKEGENASGFTFVNDVEKKPKAAIEVLPTPPSAAPPSAIPVVPNVAAVKTVFNESNQISVNAPPFIPAANAIASAPKVQPFSNIQSNVQHQPYPQFYTRHPFSSIPSNFPIPGSPLPVTTTHSNYQETNCINPNIYQHPDTIYNNSHELKSDEMVDSRHKSKPFVHDRVTGRRKSGINEKKNQIESTTIDMSNMMIALEGYGINSNDEGHCMRGVPNPVIGGIESEKLNHGAPPPQTMLSMQHPPPPYHMNPNLHMPPGSSSYASPMHFSPQGQVPPAMIYFLPSYPPGFVPGNSSAQGAVSPLINSDDMVNHVRPNHVIATHYEGQPLTMSHSYSAAHQTESFIPSSVEGHYMPSDNVATYTTKSNVHNLYSPPLTSVSDVVTQSNIVVKTEPVTSENSFQTYDHIISSNDLSKTVNEVLPVSQETNLVSESGGAVVQEVEEVPSVTEEVIPVRSKTPVDVNACLEDSGVDLGVESPVSLPPPDIALQSAPTATTTAESNSEKTSSSVSWGGQKSWASLFKSTKTSALSQAPHSGETNTNCIENGHIGTSVELSMSEHDFLSERLGKFLQSYHLNFNSQSVQPRGLINRSNWCYINATLQALLVCPLFYNLLRDLPISGTRGKSTNTPVMNSLVNLIHEFVPLNSVHKNNKKDELNIGSAFEPQCVHQMLTLIKSECVKGRQEDAEEFLSCILNGLHEEMLTLIKSVAVKQNGTCNGVEAANGHSDSNEEENESLDWRLMGKKGKGVVTRCSAQHSQSPITSIFGGQIRSLLTAETTSATLQPFFTLPLDIQADGVDSVADALTHFTVKEMISGYICPKTKKEIEASRRLTLEELPFVLILHFKRFIYEYQDGGSKKVLKKTEYPLDLEIKKELLSTEVRGKYGAKHLRTYRLFAVVYHDGKEAVKGHYIADIYHTGTSSWLRCDDRKINPTTEQQVLAYNSPCVPYLLFYGRSDAVHMQ